jgi:enamine deaminase RidA (YjgF/YER057c/UK114 family)
MTMESIVDEKTAMKFSLNRAGHGQAFLVASIRSPADAAQAARESYAGIAGALREHQLEIIHERIFGSLSVEQPVMVARHCVFQTHGISPDNPVTYIQGNPPWGEGFSGAIIDAVHRGNDVRTIWDGDIPCGRGWRRNDLTYLVLQNISHGRDIIPVSKYPNVVIPASEASRESFLRTKKDSGQAGMTESESLSLINCRGNSMSKPTQTRLMLDRAEWILRENGASYGDVVRTWFYLSDIMDWYAEFNRVRNEKYGEFGIMPGPGDGDLLLPASTGIRGDTPSGASATVDLIAIVREAGTRPAVKQLTNTSQLDAFRYGSAFSRGAVIYEPDVSLIQVSGTAAIDQQGKTQFADDIRGQITCTFDKIEKLISKEGAGLKDIAAATVFVKRPEHASVFWEMARERGLEEFPAVCVVADVCRDELLFEIDAEAVVRRK